MAKPLHSYPHQLSYSILFEQELGLVVRIRALGLSQLGGILCNGFSG